MGFDALVGSSTAILKLAICLPKPRFQQFTYDALC